MNLVILGPQGSGKGTQAKLLCEKFNFFYFEAGKFLRDLASQREDIDKIVNEKGALIPDEQMFELVKTYLEEKNIWDNILFDGYPRSIRQYELLKDLLKKKNTKLDIAIFLDIDDNEAIKRLSARRINPKTGEIYNLITNPPGAEINQQDLIQREDDTPNAIKERLLLYHKQTAPLVEKLKSEQILVEADAKLPIDEIFNKLSEVIENK